MAKLSAQGPGRLIAEALAGNILPLTSLCNARCLFCSHRQNPPEVEVLRIPPLGLQQVEQYLPLLDPGRPIVLGESVTRVIEGEPFTHPHFAEVLALLRQAYPATAIQVTTNGSLLDEKSVALLADLGNVSLNLSLNCASPAGRTFLMGGAGAGRAIDSPRLLKEHGVPFHGSVVAMPHLTGWDDLEGTVRHLAFHGAATVRVFLPGFTRLAPPELRFGPELPGELFSFVERLKKDIQTPVTCEPPRIPDLAPRVSGVLAGSVAERAGLRPGDEIMSAGSYPARTRVEAFRAVAAAENPALVVRRNGLMFGLNLVKGAGDRSGLVMDYDIDPCLVEEMAQAANRRRASRVLVLASELGHKVLSLGLGQFYRGRVDFRVVAVENRFFGGSIGAAGLLTARDMESALVEFLAVSTGWAPDLLLVPAIAFDGRGKDLTGRAYLDVPGGTGLAVEAI